MKRSGSDGAACGAATKAQTSTPETREAVDARRNIDIASIINGIGVSIARPPFSGTSLHSFAQDVQRGPIPQLRHPPRETGHFKCLPGRPIHTHTTISALFTHVGLNWAGESAGGSSIEEA